MSARHTDVCTGCRYHDPVKQILVAQRVKILSHGALSERDGSRFVLRVVTEVSRRRGHSRKNMFAGC